MIQAAIAQVLDGESLDRTQAYAVIDEIMRGEATQAQIAGFLVALRAKGETTDEIAGCAEAVRDTSYPSTPPATTWSTWSGRAATEREPSASRPSRRSSRPQPAQR